MDNVLPVRVDLFASSLALETHLLQNLGHYAIVWQHAADLVTDHALILPGRDICLLGLVLLLGKAFNAAPAGNGVALFASEKVFLHDHAGAALEVGDVFLEHVATVNVDLVKRHDWAFI